MKIKSSLIALLFSLTTLPALADAVAGYYDSCLGKTSAELLKALGDVVGPHTQLGYDALWAAFKTTDIDETGSYLVDMYSTQKWVPDAKKCGTYSVVGDCYNREHSFPKSWFGDGKPMYSDLFHLYPTDGRVNGQRSNYPFGECSNGTTLPAGGSVKALGRLGTSTFPGYNGTVFEPDDEFKGDFARTYFYMAAAYNSRISNWSSDMLDKTSYPAFTTWAVNLLLKWHRQDPVSPKETRRNDAVESLQHNRNPFIDHPELAEYIWGNQKGSPWFSDDTEASISSPAEGYTLDLGKVAANTSTTKSLYIKTKGVRSGISLRTSNTAWTLSVKSLTSAQANEGAVIYITFTAPSQAGASNATLTIEADDISRTVALRADVTTNPNLSIAGISDDSFSLQWVNVHGSNAKYVVHVVDADDNEVDGMPETVNASEGAYTVMWLEPLTTYEAWLETPDGATPRLSVTTLAPSPTIDILTPAPLAIESIAGEVSEAVRIDIHTANLTGDILAGVAAPFEVSADKSAWGSTATLAADADRLWLRVTATTKGVYNEVLSLVGNGVEAEADIVATVNESPDAVNRVETFENATVQNYDGGTYNGSAAKWTITETGVWPQNAYAGNNAARFSKSTGSSLVMAEDLNFNITAVSFEGARWSAADGDVNVDLDYSTDHGATWHTAASFTITGDDKTYSQYATLIKANAPVRLRLIKTAGARALIDDITVSGSTSAIADVDADMLGTWTVTDTDGAVTVTSTATQGISVSIYSVSGSKVAVMPVAPGATATMPLAPGVYIICSHDTGAARRVFVK